MKKFSLVIAAAFFVLQTFAQTTTGKLTDLKDAWGTATTYIGEIENKQPNGLGVAIYNNDYALRYAGNFTNGLYNGKGALLFKDGSFLSGTWKNGKLNGEGSYLNKDGDLYVGSFNDGKKDGHGVLFYKDNGFLLGEFGDDTYNGRCIYIAKEADNLSDNIYVDGKKNGTGYQYDLSAKKLYEGEWKEGDWVQATTAAYKSFLKDPAFYAEKTDDQIMMGIIENEKSLLNDTAFFYDLVKKKRYFGYYHKGYMDEGIIIRDDTSRFLGKINDDGAYGYGHFLKFDKFYDEGTYVNDYTQGDNILSIDLDKKTIYYGANTGKGEFTGKAYYANKSNDLYVGDFVKGLLHGEGYRIDKNGVCIRGTWKENYPVTATSITDGNGMPFVTKPKTLSEAILIAAREYDSYYDNIFGELLNEDDADNTLSEDYSYVNKSLITFPGTQPGSLDLITEDDNFDVAYHAVYIITDDAEKAKAKYMDLCKQVLASNIVAKKGSTPEKPTGEIVNVSDVDKKTVSTFDIESIRDFNLYVIMQKDSSKNSYEVKLVLGYMSDED